MVVVVRVAHAVVVAGSMMQPPAQAFRDWALAGRGV